jgi:hypothetical protein
MILFLGLKKTIKLKCILKNVEGFDGEGDLFSKFGVEIRDEATFIIARRRWNSLVKSNQIIKLHL